MDEHVEFLGNLSAGSDGAPGAPDIKSASTHPRQCHIERALYRQLHRQFQRDERERLGVSQDELAAVAGISVRCLRDIELGNAEPRGSTVEAIVGALGRLARLRHEADLVAFKRTLSALRAA